MTEHDEHIEAADRTREVLGAQIRLHRALIPDSPDTVDAGRRQTIGKEHTHLHMRREDTVRKCAHGGRPPTP